MGKVVTKKNKTYTMMIIPHAKNSVASWQIPIWMVNLGWGLLACFIVFVGYCGYSYYQMAQATKELAYYRQVNSQNSSYIAQLKSEIQQLNEETISMQEKLIQVKELEVVVREMVGLEQASESSLDDRKRIEDLPSIRVQTFSSSRGGSESSPSYDQVMENLETIDQIISSTTAELGQLVEDVAGRMDYLHAQPSRWPVNGRVTSGFGYRKNPFGRGREFHNGIDIAAPTGTAVKAAGKGKVVFAGWRAGYGRTVIIDHGYGLKSLYAHNSSLLVKNGQWVEPNQVIAKVGSTGRSTGPHLHFTVELKGKPVNPYNYLK